MGERTQVNAQLSTDQKARWEQYAEDQQRSLSQLIRLAVEKEISSENRNRLDSTDELTTHLSQLTEDIQRVEKKLTKIDRRLGSVEQEVKENPEVTALANEVFGVLPETEDEIMEALYQEQQGEPIPPERRARSGRIEDIAQALDEKEHRVQDALARLQQDTTLVQTTEIADETRYYKEE